MCRVCNTASSMLNQIPTECLGKIATYLDGESLMALLLCDKGVNAGITRHKDYIQSQRTFVTFTANPYRHCLFKNTNQLPKPLLAFDVQDELKDMCDTGKVYEEEIITQYPGCFKWRLDNGKNGQYITQLLIKSTFEPDDYIWIKYGNNAIDLHLDETYMKLLQRDSNGFYHLFLDKILLVPKLVKGFTDESHFYIEVKSGGITTLRVIRQKVNTTKANAFINAYKNQMISMPRVQSWYHDTASTSDVHTTYLECVFGSCVAICVDVCSLINNKTIQSDLIEDFKVHITKGDEVLDTFSIKANMVHSTIVQKYKSAIQWGNVTFKDCFIIPIYGNYNIHKLRVDILFKSPMKVKINSMHLCNYKYIYYSL